MKNRKPTSNRQSIKEKIAEAARKTVQPPPKAITPPKKGDGKKARH